jgi:hypothetical protein
VWFALLYPGGSSGGGYRCVSLFCCLTWLLLFGILRGLPLCVVCDFYTFVTIIIKCCARLYKKLILLIIHAQRDGTHKSETILRLPWQAHGCEVANFVRPRM